jgi:hypothetical protein
MSSGARIAEGYAGPRHAPTGEQAAPPERTDLGAVFRSATRHRRVSRAGRAHLAVIAEKILDIQRAGCYGAWLMSSPSRLHFIETDRTTRPRYRAAARASLGFYFVGLGPDGRWAAEHTVHGPVSGGPYASKEIAMRACAEDDARREGK